MAAADQSGLPQTKQSIGRGQLFISRVWRQETSGKKSPGPRAVVNKFRSKGALTDSKTHGWSFFPFQPSLAPPGVISPQRQDGEAARVAAGHSRSQGE